MKKILFALLLLPVIASAQRLQYVNTYGHQYQRVVVDSLFAPPSDTFTVPTALQGYPFIARKGTGLYLWNTSTHVWAAVSGSGSTPTWQNTLLTSGGSEITTSIDVEGNGNGFNFQNFGDFNINTNGGLGFSYGDGIYGSGGITHNTGAIGFEISHNGAGEESQIFFGAGRLWMLHGAKTKFEVKTDTATVEADNFRINIPSAGAGKFLTSNSNGNATWTSTLPATSVPLSGITAATGTNSIDNTEFMQTWNWSGMTGGGLSLNSATTAGTSNHKLFQSNLSGALSTPSISSYAGWFTNTHTGTSLDNFGIRATASGGTTNTGGFFAGTETGINIAAGSLSLNGSAGTSGQVLTSAGANTLPTWQTPSSSGWGTSGTVATLTGNSTLAGGGYNWTHSNVGNYTINTASGGTIYNQYNGTTRLYVNSGESVLFSPNQSRAFWVEDAKTKLVGLANLSTQDKILGLYNAGSEVGYLNLSGLSISSGTLSVSSGAGMVYPGAGIPNSTGSAWGTSYGTTGSGSNVALSTSPVFTTNITTPKILGGTATNQKLTIQTTSGVGSGDSVLINGGNNGATNWASFANAGLDLKDGAAYKIGGSSLLSYSTGSNNATFAGAYNYIFNNGGNVFMNPATTTYFNAGTGDLYLSGSGSKIGIGTASPAASSLLDVSSTTKGVLIPRMTTTQRNAISSPAVGLQIYNTTDSAFNYYRASGWTAIGGSSQWTTTGSDIYYNTGNVGIGTATPGASLHVIGNGKFSGSVITNDINDGGSGGIEITATDTKLNLTNNSGNPINIISTAGGGVFIDGGTGGAFGAQADGSTSQLTGSLYFVDNAGHNILTGINTITPSGALDVKANGGAIDALFVDNTSGNVGIGTATPNSTLHNNGSFAGKYTATATGITLDATNYVVNVTATGQTITLPDAAGIEGRIYTIKLTASGSCTVATSSSQTIDGSGSYSLASQYKYVTVMSDSSNWIVIANN